MIIFDIQDSQKAFGSIDYSLHCRMPFSAERSRACQRGAGRHLEMLALIN